jgi:hypothetical protein
MVTELGGPVFAITHDLVGDLFRAKTRALHKASPEYHTMEALCGGPEYTGTVGCRAATYSTSSRKKSGSSSEK